MVAWAVTLDAEARRSGKLAPQIAKCIETEVIRLGWPVGHLLGKEEVLAEAFGVSRAVMREALAMTERDGVTRRQRGRAGGVYVAEPAAQAVMMALGNYLVSAGLGEAQYGEGYRLLNGAALRLAAQGCSEDAALSARALCARPLGEGLDAIWQRINAVHLSILRMAGNQVLEVFCGALVYSGMQRLYSRLLDTEPVTAQAFAEATLARITRQLEAVIAGDDATALLLDREAMQAWQGYYQPGKSAGLDADTALRVAEGIAAIYHPGKQVKIADVLAMRLQHDIAAGRHLPGDRLDSEPVLLKRYQVSRGALRDAIRALEQHGLVRMEEGRGGGLCVAAPDPAEVVRSAVIFFRFLGVGASGLLPLVGEIEMALVSSAAQQVLARGPGVLQDFSAAIRPSRTPDNRVAAQRNLEAIYAGLARAGGNPLLILLVQVLTAILTVAGQVDSTGGLLDAADYERYLARLQEVEAAMLRGDAALARRVLLLASKSVQDLPPQARDLRQLMDLLYR